MSTDTKTLTIKHEHKTSFKVTNKKLTISNSDKKTQILKQIHLQSPTNTLIPKTEKTCNHTQTSKAPKYINSNQT